MVISGAKRLMASSNRTWSLPLPVQPWQMASAPSSQGDLHQLLGDDGPGKGGAQQILSSYLASAMTEGMMTSSTISSVRSATMSSWRRSSGPFPPGRPARLPWPTSPETAMISGLS